MAKVVLKDVFKVYPNRVVAVNNINLNIADKEFIVLVGPSGCGKSTTLRMVAGLEEVTKGTIQIDGQIVNDVPAKNRDIAMVFQNYALYPHMTVYDNMAFGLKLRHFPSREIDRRVKEAAEILGITERLSRKPKELSGGERQRVAVGRAIVRKPKVFLFDEPLSNLDAKLRVQMRMEIQKLHKRLQTTMIYVTHDQIEALTLGDRIVVMKDGLIQQIDDPIRLYETPINKFVAGFIGSPPVNFLNGKLIKKNGVLYFVDNGIKLKVLQQHETLLAPYLNQDVLLGIRPEDVYDKLFAQDASDDFTITATVDLVEPMGSEIYLYFSVGRNNFIARVSNQDTATANQDLQLVFDMSKAHFFDAKTEKAIL
ncbi:MAG: glycerol-3-phosphate ABC transporter ATP-binding protein [Omnitrophica bacterium RIFCSPLOWO2_12_FULL_44_17]|uniref:Glycerol-3-phosphate ABC transporter ATP-binding protein n=1 Tax=Candidatus Danuiimicrobium aquiferis TaxID=1801832 RepID=A0A1G1KUW7_9BACT|nr:MAG: glycerol-3-phosphate ABC transporter ATP-binding protein [Omnitrophica bacterium RIFCSPHIGHO2_02_FULL_45_28]OGW90183.1 MAG: glycerol-3-phosphate ABC transporter ATP-binding protein [Omnitrophica bacterium RIFCSPHIGHO2_12_FULL_44_12]OGW96359.1 MAG: glycerol-3-phosphate ABC transporter ATP-binding protein [Omnitrophica bacterium RIFCSPLOWO2_12_FULL_44_17]OGX04832.1 MAG: glycerol-3-phosphate ABC transporter ATP-binding protein [Omnitrophica bacterium RIFCSPLOWO2_02_FULL_44_11]